MSNWKGASREDESTTALPFSTFHPTILAMWHHHHDRSMEGGQATLQCEPVMTAPLAGPRSTLLHRD
eukprot:2181607-Rhodomonas_salina.2